MLFPIYIVCALLFWVLLIWGLDHPKGLGWASLIAFIIYLIGIVVLVFICSSERKKKEREFIKLKVAEHLARKKERKLE